MGVHICIEALIRLFFEIIRVLFGNVTLLWKGGYFETELPALLSTAKWVFIFILITMLVKNKFFRNILVIGIPAAINLLIDMLGMIPFIGTFLSIGVGIAGAPIAALGWAFVLWTDQEIHPLMRVAATPGIMILAAINAVQPFSIFGDLGYAVVITKVPIIAGVGGIAFIGIVIAIGIDSLCALLNYTLKKWEAIRYEGFVSAILSCFILIKNKIYKP